MSCNSCHFKKSGKCWGWADWYLEVSKWICKNCKNINDFNTKVFIPLKNRNTPFYSNIKSEKEIDPFTFFASFSFNPQKQPKKRKTIEDIINAINKHILEKKRKINIGRSYGLSTEHPTNLLFFDSTAKNKTQQLADLFSLFQEAHEAANSGSFPGSSSNFSNCFNKICSHKSVNINKLTKGLFWIRPDFFVSMDEHMRQYLNYKGSTQCKFNNYENYYKNYFWPRFTDKKEICVLSGEAFRESKRGRESEYAEYYEYITLKILKTLEIFRQIILYGPPGTGKTYLAKQIAKHFDEKYKIVQFHPSYNYEDFVCGLVAKTKNSAVVYEWKNKIFAQMCEEAKKKQKVLIIDEINRANLAAVLGELTYALEYRGESIELPSGEQLSVPENLYIIGTMNTADRSIGHIDYAVRRRFAFIEVLPNRGILEQFYQDKKNPALELFDSIENLFKNCLCPDYSWREVQPGHTYFMAESKEELFYKFMYQLWPLLLEYAADGVLCCRDCPPGNQCPLGEAFREGETFPPESLDELLELAETLGPGKTGKDDAASEEEESQRDDV